MLLSSMTCPRQSVLSENKSSFDFELLEHFHYVLYMLSDTLRVYEYIVKIYMYKPSKKFLEYRGHQLLKCGGCIGVSHLHYSALKGAEYCRECCLAEILWSYAHLLISFSHIQFGSEFSLCYIMMYHVLIWERCYIFPCILVLLLQIEYSS